MWEFVLGPTGKIWKYTLKFEILRNIWFFAKNFKVKASQSDVWLSLLKAHLDTYTNNCKG